MQKNLSYTGGSVSRGTLPFQRSERLDSRSAWASLAAAAAAPHRLSAKMDREPGSRAGDEFTGGERAANSQTRGGESQRIGVGLKEDEGEKAEGVKERRGEDGRRTERFDALREDEGEIAEVVRDERVEIDERTEGFEALWKDNGQRTQSEKATGEYSQTALDVNGIRLQSMGQNAGNDWQTENNEEIKRRSSLGVKMGIIKRTSVNMSRDKLEPVRLEFVNNEEPKTRNTVRNRCIPIRFILKLVQQLREPQINRLTLYVFGSEDAVLKECERARNVGTFIIHPYSTSRTYYVMFKLVLTFLNLTFTPLGITFFDHDQGIKTFVWRGFSFASDIFYLVDIIINFRVGISTEDPEVVILNPKDIAKHYIKTWFLADLAAAFPLDSILFFKITEYQMIRSSSFSKFLRIFYFGRIINLVRLLYASNLMRRFKEWELATDLNLEPIQLLLRTLSVCFIILLVCHWNGCLQFFIPMMQGFPNNSWVVKANLTRAWWADQYAAGVLRAISHTLGNSYGAGGLPTELTEVAYTVVSMISGALMYSLMVGNVAAMVLNADTSERIYRRKLCQVEQYMKNKRLPRNLQLKISSYYRERYHGKWFDEEGIISELSEYLREDILGYLCRNLVNNVPMFQNADPNFLKAVITNLRYEVFQKDDVIIREGAVAERMFFIESGIVSVETSYYQKLLSDGAYFGEICLLTKGFRKATVRAVTLCKLYSLTADKFNDLLKQFPAAKEDVVNMAAQRQRALIKAIDLWELSRDLQSP
ncbi:potassium/sodium hyperpolarization-activated cyclic nucleotide-gated channel 2-like [Hemitrygon akajei]|uniref:potassium/sodium hyperpolarization-activated cyclic nucleotide-gated channel 2-like n=1 Tax=Hemitrygon akajei TaxID=2704970 RepID=UPI003BF9E7AA